MCLLKNSTSCLNKVDLSHQPKRPSFALDMVAWSFRTSLVRALVALLISVGTAAGVAATDLSEQPAVVAKALGLTDHKVSLQILEKYISLHPDAADAYFHAARMANVLGIHKKTVQFANSYLELKPVPIDFYIYHLRAQAYNCTGQSGKALADLAIARKAQPKDTEIALLEGMAHLNLKRPKEAIKDFALAAKSNDPNAYRMKAETELNQKDVRSAAADYVEFAKRVNDIGPVLAIVQKLSKKGQGDDAILILNELDSANLPSAQQILEFKANILYNNNRKKEALDTCNRYEKKFKLTNLYTVKYLIVWADKDFESSLVCLNGMIKARPQERQLYLLRADCYRALDEYAKALADYKQVSDLVVKDIKRRCDRAECNYQLGNYEVAANEFHAVNNLEPSAKGYEREGQCLMSQKKYKDAVVCLSRAVRMTPLNAGYICTRGDCYRRLKDYPRALRDFSDGITLQPDNMLYVFGRGVCFSELGRNEEAIKDFTTAMSNPNLLSRACLERAKVYDRVGEKAKAEADRNAAQKSVKSVESDFFR